MVGPEELTGWWEEGPRACAIFQEGLTSQTTEQQLSVCLQDTFASLRFSKVGGTQVIWHNPLWEVLPSSALLCSRIHSACPESHNRARM